MSQLRLALRTLFKTPFVTAVAALSLALGIGANAAIYSLFHQLLLRPLPVPEPAALVNLSAPGPKPGSQSSGVAGRTEDVFSYPMFRDLEREQSVFTGIAAHRSLSANLAAGGRTENLDGLLVSGSYFPVLGLQPALGRLFGPDDDRTPGGHPLVVLAHDYWRARFGSDPRVLDQSLLLNGRSLRVVGVAPAGFRGTSLGVEPRLFVPISMRPALVPNFDGLEDRRSYWVYLFARLRPGVSPERAESALNAAYAPILREVEAPLQERMSDETLARFRDKRLSLNPGARGQSLLHAESRTPLTLLLGVTGLVLLIACANVANLLLARGAGRSGEMALRLSLGATRRRLVGQLLLESLLLAALGGGLGVLLAAGTLRGVHSLLPGQAAAALQPVLEPPVLLFAFALSLATGLAFGLFPALETTRPDLVTALRRQAGQPGGSALAARLRSLVATGQIALSMALLVAAGLFTRSLVNVSRVDLGIRTERLLTFAVSPELNGYGPERSRALFERLEQELGALPGVSHVAASQVPLISGSNWGTSVRVEGIESGPDSDTHSQYNQVSPGYFEALGIPLVSGREFSRAEVLGAARVAVVNQAFARKFELPPSELLGRHIRPGFLHAGEGAVEIVGLVPDTSYSEVKQPPPPQLFVPWRQDASIGRLQYYVRASLEAEALLGPVAAAVQRLDPELPVEELRTMREQVEANVFVDRFIATLSASFAGLATLLAAIGLYGVLAYSVGQRTRELGLRMALGADAPRIRHLVLSQVARMTLVGGALGLLAALALGRLARSLLFGLEGHDLGALLGAALALVLVAALAGYLPAWRASRVDPMVALRWE